ncbi:amylo-alpha-1,6-glucosidase [Myxococcus sp. RHSTA-1-4]|uniref:amylo-alpha-1,6-glucosidase n=1 Tax=Myxococcus sp. RHSTA-1-4 TaxID=2874601 RepID=UPI002105D2C0|nr:amylo-alpha-1,6-glucosidase [Myxococcus sp. RHSTA-1-4]
MLNQLTERIILPDGRMGVIGGSEQAPGRLDVHGLAALKEFRLEQGLPVWRYEAAGYALEKRILMLHQQNTVHVHYALVSGKGQVTLEVSPSLQFRRHEDRLDTPVAEDYPLTRLGDRYELRAPEPFPPLRMRFVGHASTFLSDPRMLENMYYRIEERRGYDSGGRLWSPGSFRVELSFERPASLVASTEDWEIIDALSPAQALNFEWVRRERLLRAAHPAARSGLGPPLVFAADQFIITPAGRVADAARVHASGDELRSVIAGYHWFTDWGRDTMISLEGLTLVTGRPNEARDILRTFAFYLRDGLIPNLFPEGGNEGLYHTADATLWFFNAFARYYEATGDRESLRRILPLLRDIVAHHVRGTRFNIGVDPADGLIRQGQSGYQLSWMDAKVGDWVVTPRRGKTVEINALWYNALMLLAGWVRELVGEQEAREYAELAARVRASFNARFWIERRGYLYDLVDGERGDDAAFRPNQLLSLSLTHPVLDEDRWAPVLENVMEQLFTPVGLRSLAPGHPDYKPRYDGDLRSRDAAYHQGTVWAWLAGPLVDAWLRVHPGDRAGARALLKGFESELGEAGLGTIAEIFDADPPFTPRGCVAQAWSVAEVLRAWVKTAPDDGHEGTDRGRRHRAGR